MKKVLSRVEVPGAKTKVSLKPAHARPISVQRPQNIWLAARASAALVLILSIAASSLVLLSNNETLVNVRLRLAQLMFVEVSSYASTHVHPLFT